VEVSCIQHVVSQMSHEQPVGEVAMERLRQEFIASYFA
jgi:hypothetical protein